MHKRTHSMGIHIYLLRIWYCQNFAWMTLDGFNSEALFIANVTNNVCCHVRATDWNVNLSRQNNSLSLSLSHTIFPLNNANYIQIQFDVPFDSIHCEIKSKHNQSKYFIAPFSETNHFPKRDDFENYPPIIWITANRPSCLSAFDILILSI